MRGSAGVRPGRHYRYIDHSNGEAALKALQQDLRNIEQGLDRGNTQNYGAVHLALYRSLKREWQYNCTVLENVEQDDLQSRLNSLLLSDSPNLNQNSTRQFDPVKQSWQKEQRHKDHQEKLDPAGEELPVKT